MPTIRWSVTEKRMWDLLSDGVGHTTEELKRLLPDDFEVNANNVTFHISRMRKKLRAHGLDILRRRGGCYIAVRELRIRDE